MDRQVVEVSLSFFLSLSLSFSFSDYLPTYLPIYLSVFLSVCLSLYLCVCLSIYLQAWKLCLSVYLSICLSIYVSICPSIFLPIYLSIDLSVCLSICLPVYLSICVSVYLSIYLSIYLSVYLQAWKPSYFARLLDFFKVDNIKKRSNSAWLPHFSKLTTWKTKQFCETSSFFEVDNIKNEAILRHCFIFLDWTTSKMKQFCDTASFFWTGQHPKWSNSARLIQFLNLTTSKNNRLPSKTESWVQSWQPRTNAFCHFSSPPVESIARATKKSCQVIRSAAPVTQNHLRKSAPSPPNSSDQDVSCTAPATENASLQILFKCPTPAIVFGNATKPSRFAHFRQGAPATRNEIWTSKNGPYMVCFVHFDLEMCFAPQRRALLRHLNFQKWSDNGVFCTFWLRHVLRAATACTFSTSQLPKVLRPCGVFSFFTCKCASRHNGVHFFDIATSKSGPTMVCFVHFDLETCFAPQRRALFHLSSGQLAPHPPL